MFYFELQTYTFLLEYTTWRSELLFYHKLKTDRLYRIQQLGANIIKQFLFHWFRLSYRSTLYVKLQLLK